VRAIRRKNIQQNWAVIKRKRQSRAWRIQNENNSCLKWWRGKNPPIFPGLEAGKISAAKSIYYGRRWRWHSLIFCNSVLIREYFFGPHGKHQEEKKRLNAHS
jgi:hypothetical protein